MEPGSEARDDGTRDHARAIALLARRLPAGLDALATIAYDYGWTWTPGGRDLFHALDAERFELTSGNPVRFLRDLPEEKLHRAADDPSFVAQTRAVANALAAHSEPARHDVGPVAFLCAEFGIHPSLPTYSGGLGILAGDYLKEASDSGFPLVAVGLFYRRGYFHQRIDLSGWQRESWELCDPESLPMARVTAAAGEPLLVRLPVWDEEIAVGVWRVQIGHVPLYLLDTDLAENTPVERWVTSRLYEGTRAIRLAQYAVLGLGGVRALDAMGIVPERFHLNEGHPALAAVEMATRAAGPGTPLADAIAAVRERFVFTTHTPLPAGNEAYSHDELVSVLGRVPIELGFDAEELVRLGRVRPDDEKEPSGLTPLAIRASRKTVGVSRRHGDVARAMWAPLLATLPEHDPIGYATNGVHLPTWMAPEPRQLLGRYLGDGWERRATDTALWDGVDLIPDEELWAVRSALRKRLVEAMRLRVVTDALARGEDLPAVEGGAELLSDDALTVGFARRLASYKRLGLLIRDPERAQGLFAGARPLQLVIAGKAHPLDDAGKAIAQQVFSFRRETALRGRATFLEDYDLRIAPALVAGCDVWLNVPRPPLEASGTSGMKAALNGSLNVSVLDGWWPEAYDGENGWAVDGAVDADEPAQDERHASALYDLLENEVLPAFYDRDESGIPRAWMARMKRSLKTVGSSFTTARMLADYAERVYR